MVGFSVPKDLTTPTKSFSHQKLCTLFVLRESISVNTPFPICILLSSNSKTLHGKRKEVIGVVGLAEQLGLGGFG